MSHVYITLSFIAPDNIASPLIIRMLYHGTLSRIIRHHAVVMSRDLDLILAVLLHSIGTYASRPIVSLYDNITHYYSMLYYTMRCYTIVSLI